MSFFITSGNNYKSGSSRGDNTDKGAKISQMQRGNKAQSKDNKLAKRAFKVDPYDYRPIRVGLRH